MSRERILKNSDKVLYFDIGVPLNVNNLDRAMRGRHRLYFDSRAAHCAKNEEGEEDVLGFHFSGV
jgi:hypothetical protein